MNEPEKRPDVSKVVGGALLILLGLLFLLDEFRVLHFGQLVRTYWPMIIVGIALPKLFRPQTLFAGLWLMAVGFWLQAVQLRWFGLTYGNSWPLLLIVLGGGIILRTIVESLLPARREEIEERHGS